MKHANVLYFYPRSPYGERRGTLSDTSDVTAISIHALLTESDPIVPVELTTLVNISIHALLTESDYLATRKPYYVYGISIHALLTESDDTSSLMRCQVKISIHALLTESDIFKISFLFRLTNFYPRSPYGERQLNSS